MTHSTWETILSFALIKTALSLIAFLVVAGIIFMLWQRQPKTPTEQETQQATQSAQDQRANSDFSVSPQDGTVLSSNEIKIEGRGQAQNTVLIYSNSFQDVARSDHEGNFSAQISLADGLNLIKIVFVDENLEITKENSLTYFVGEENSDLVAAGAVKSIFDSLVTITSSAKDINVRTSKSTNFDVPKEESQEATNEVDNIRIGDFAIALGTASDDDSMQAKSLEIIRQNKPQIEKQFITGTIASTVRQNLFSTKNKKDNQIIEFTLSRNSEVSKAGEEGENTDIQKDKTAIIFYTKNEDENPVDLIYLLP